MLTFKAGILIDRTSSDETKGVQECGFGRKTDL